MNQFPDDDTGNALALFQQNGFDLSKPMTIDFFVAVSSRKTGEKVAMEAEKLGFTVSVEQDQVSKEWTCYCAKTLIPEYSIVVKIEEQLNNIAKVYGGYSDGFGSYGNFS